MQFDLGLCISLGAYGLRTRLEDAKRGKTTHKASSDSTWDLRRSIRAWVASESFWRSFSLLYSSSRYTERKDHDGK